MPSGGGNAGEVRVKLTLDIADLRTQLRNAEQTFSQGTGIKVPLKFTVSGDEAGGLQEELQRRMSSRPIPVKLTLAENAEAELGTKVSNLHPSVSVKLKVETKKTELDSQIDELKPKAIQIPVQFVSGHTGKASVSAVSAVFGPPKKIQNVPQSASKVLASAAGEVSSTPQAPKRARGGVVSPYTPYRVGEEGPETFIPGGAGGYIIPHAHRGLVAHPHPHTARERMIGVASAYPRPDRPSLGERIARYAPPPVEPANRYKTVSETPWLSVTRGGQVVDIGNPATTSPQSKEVARARPRFALPGRWSEEYGPAGGQISFERRKRVITRRAAPAIAEPSATSIIPPITSVGQMVRGMPGPLEIEDEEGRLTRIGEATPGTLRRIGRRMVRADEARHLPQHLQPRRDYVPVLSKLGNIIGRTVPRGPLITGEAPAVQVAYGYPTTSIDEEMEAWMSPTATPISPLLFTPKGRVRGRFLDPSMRAAISPTRRPKRGRRYSLFDVKARIASREAFYSSPRGQRFISEMDPEYSGPADWKIGQTHIEREVTKGPYTGYTNVGRGEWDRNVFSQFEDYSPYGDEEIERLGGDPDVLLEESLRRALYYTRDKKYQDYIFRVEQKNSAEREANRNAYDEANSKIQTALEFVRSNNEEATQLRSWFGMLKDWNTRNQVVEGNANPFFQELGVEPLKVPEALDPFDPANIPPLLKRASSMSIDVEGGGGLTIVDAIRRIQDLMRVKSSGLRGGDPEVAQQFADLIGQSSRGVGDWLIGAAKVSEAAESKWQNMSLEEQRNQIQNKGQQYTQLHDELSLVRDSMARVSRFIRSGGVAEDDEDDEFIKSLVGEEDETYDELLDAPDPFEEMTREIAAQYKEELSPEEKRVADLADAETRLRTLQRRHGEIDKELRRLTRYLQPARSFWKEFTKSQSYKRSLVRQKIGPPTAEYPEGAPLFDVQGMPVLEDEGYLSGLVVSEMPAVRRAALVHQRTLREQEIPEELAKIDRDEADLLDTQGLRPSSAKARRFLREDPQNRENRLARQRLRDELSELNQAKQVRADRRRAMGGLIYASSGRLLPRGASWSSPISYDLGLPGPWSEYRREPPPGKDWRKPYPTMLEGARELLKHNEMPDETPRPWLPEHWEEARESARRAGIKGYDDGGDLEMPPQGGWWSEATNRAANSARTRYWEQSGSLRGARLPGARRSFSEILDSAASSEYREILRDKPPFMDELRGSWTKELDAMGWTGGQEGPFPVPQALPEGLPGLSGWTKGYTNNAYRSDLWRKFLGGDPEAKQVSLSLAGIAGRFPAREGFKDLKPDPSAISRNYAGGTIAARQLAPNQAAGHLPELAHVPGAVLVGEHGPEVIVPGASGGIVFPNHWDGDLRSIPGLAGGGLWSPIRKMPLTDRMMMNRIQRLYSEGKYEEARQLQIVLEKTRGGWGKPKSFHQGGDIKPHLHPHGIKEGQLTLSLPGTPPAKRRVSPRAMVLGSVAGTNEELMSPEIPMMSNVEMEAAGQLTLPMAGEVITGGVLPPWVRSVTPKGGPQPPPREWRGAFGEGRHVEDRDLGILDLLERGPQYGPYRPGDFSMRPEAYRADPSFDERIQESAGMLAARDARRAAATQPTALPARAQSLANVRDAAAQAGTQATVQLNQAAAIGFVQGLSSPQAARAAHQAAQQAASPAAGMAAGAVAGVGAGMAGGGGGGRAGGAAGAPPAGGGAVGGAPPAGGGVPPGGAPPGGGVPPGAPGPIPPAVPARVMGTTPSDVKVEARQMSLTQLDEYGEKVARLRSNIAEQISLTPVRALSVSVGQIFQQAFGGRAGIQERARIAQKAVDRLSTEATFLSTKQATVNEYKLRYREAKATGEWASMTPQQQLIFRKQWQTAAKAYAVQRPYVTSAEDAAEKAAAKVSTLPLRLFSQALGLGGIAIGTTVFTASMAALSKSLELAGEATKPMLDAMSGFTGTLNTVSADLSQAVRQGGTGAGPALASWQAARGLDLALPALERRTAMLAGAASLADLQSTMRAEQAASRRTVSEGITTGFNNGFLSGIPVLGDLFGWIGQQQSFTERMGGIVGPLPEKNTRILGQEVPPSMSQVNDLVGPETWLGSVLDTLGWLEPGQQITPEQTKQMKIVWDQMNSGLKRVNPEIGKFVTGLAATSPQVQAMAEAVRGLDNGEELAKFVEAYGIALVDETGKLPLLVRDVFGDIVNSEVWDALSGGVVGLVQKSFAQTIDAMVPQTEAQIRSAARMREFQTEMVPAQLTRQLLEQPLQAPTTGLVPVFGGRPADIFGGAFPQAGMMQKYVSQIRDVNQQLMATFEEGLPRLAEISGVSEADLRLMQEYAQTTQDMRDKAANLQMGIEQAQYNEQLRISRRGLSDIVGLAGKMAATYGIVTEEASAYGQMQRAQIMDQRELTNIQLARSQRELNLQLALSRLRAPGETAEERSLRRRESEMLMAEQQRELDINRRSATRGFRIQDIDIGRQLQDALRAQNLTESQRNISFKIQGLNSVAAARDSLQKLGLKFLDIGTQFGEQMVSITNEMTATAEAASGEFLEDNARKTRQVFNNIIDNIERAYDIVVPSYQTRSERRNSGNDFGTGAVTPEERRQAERFINEQYPDTGGGNPRVGSRAAGASGGGGGSVGSVTINITASVRSDRDVEQLTRQVVKEIHRQAALVS